MQHIAIMQKNLGLIESILSGKKKIESRWYVNKINPWNNIKAGEVIYFKNSGESITAKADVERVLQFILVKKHYPELGLGTPQITFDEIVENYAKLIDLQDTSYSDYYAKKRYVILIFLKNPKKIKPFTINKTGFGNACAWLCVKDVDSIKV